MCCNFEILSSPPIKQNHKAAVACLAGGCCWCYRRAKVPPWKKRRRKKREDGVSGSCCFMTHNYCWGYDCHSAGQKPNWRARADQSVGCIFSIMQHIFKSLFLTSQSCIHFAFFLRCFFLSIFDSSLPSNQIPPKCESNLVTSAHSSNVISLLFTPRRSSRRHGVTTLVGILSHQGSRFEC